MSRNKRPIWYAQYVRTEELENGSYKPVYDSPVETRMNWSSSRGETESNVFGDAEQYDRVIVADSTMPRLTEQTRLWIGKTPADGPHNYIVKRVADSINGMMYAIRQVDVGA